MLTGNGVVSFSFLSFFSEVSFSIIYLRSIESNITKFRALNMQILSNEAMI